MTDRGFEESSFRDPLPDPGEGASGRQEGLAEHLATDTAGEDPQEADSVDLAEELEGRATPPFRTPHPRHES